MSAPPRLARLAAFALLLLPPAAALPSGLVGPAVMGHPVDPVLDEAAAGRFAALALACVHREYPNKLSHVLQGDADARPPHLLTPAFYGCLDWHSAVHGHWLLVRLARLYPKAPFASEARAALAKSLTGENLAGELEYLKGQGRASFERPYGLAWLLQLVAELRTWKDPQAQAWAKALGPLEDEAVGRLMTWLPKLRHPIRSGEHSQTAFALGLVRDWVVVKGDQALLKRLDAHIRSLYEKDMNCPLNYEPSGEDFLSPCLAEADLMRRLMVPARYATWLTRILPMIPQRPFQSWLIPAPVTDRADPKLAHADGLNLSRAWMLYGIASALPPTDNRVANLIATASSHHQATLPAVTGEHYEGGHWLGTFAVYLATASGRPAIARP